MGFFDRKTWQLRRKLKDLQSELREAEKDGRYIVEGGLYFAELEEMGDQTMLVMGSGNVHSGEERTVIVTFFDRNGFEVEALKLGKGGKGVEEVAILPPYEFLKAIVSALKVKEFRVLDDGGKERPSEIVNHMITASNLIAATNALFCTVVERIIKTTDVKMNKEGNRLLNWMPEIRKACLGKVGLDVVETVRPFFEEEYCKYYSRAVGGRSRRGPSPSARIDTVPRGGDAPPARPEASKAQERRVRLQSPAAGAKKPPSPEPPKADTTPPAAKAPPAPSAPPPAPGSGDVMDDILQEAHRAFNDAFKRFSFSVSEKLGRHLRGVQASANAGPEAASPAPGGIYSEDEVAKLMRAEQLAKVLAMMYRSLVDAKPSRCVSNSEALLKNVNRLFNASATCIMKRTGRADDSMTIYSQAGQQLAWGDSGADGFPVSASIVRNCMLQESIATSNPMLADPSASMMAYNIEATAAAPITVDDEIVGVLYADRRDDKTPFSPEDCELFRRVVKVFEEFPGLTLGV